MKKRLFILINLFVMIISTNGQTVTGYSYVLDNGINVKTVRCWNHVWVQQTYEDIKPGDQSPPVAVNIRSLGNLIQAGTTIKMLSSGKEVKMTGAAPGTYELKITSKLSGKPGSISFTLGNIVLKPKTKTSVSITLYDYQINITESPASNNGLSAYESTVNCFKDSPGQNPYKPALVFYPKGKRDAKITPDEATSEIKGKIKPGTYDVLIALGISGHKQEVWLENFAMKADVTYKINTNLNAGIIAYTGGNKEVKGMLLYPAGTAATQTAKAAPDKSKEIISYDNLTTANACRPGSYDVLLSFTKGDKYEWRKGIAVQTGVKAEVK